MLWPPVLKGQCSVWASPLSYFSKSGSNGYTFSRNELKSLNEQITTSDLKTKTLFGSNEIEGFKRTIVALSPGLTGWPQQWEMELNLGKRSACCLPQCSEGLAASLDILPPIGWAQKSLLNANSKKCAIYFFSSLSKYFKPSHLTGDTFNCILKGYHIILTLENFQMN